MKYIAKIGAVSVYLDFWSQTYHQIIRDSAEQTLTIESVNFPLFKIPSNHLWSALQRKWRLLAHFYMTFEPVGIILGQMKMHMINKG